MGHRKRIGDLELHHRRSEHAHRQHHLGRQALPVLRNNASVSSMSRKRQLWSPFICAPPAMFAPSSPHLLFCVITCIYTLSTEPNEHTLSILYLPWVTDFYFPDLLKTSHRPYISMSRPYAFTHVQAIHIHTFHSSVIVL